MKFTTSAATLAIAALASAETFGLVTIRSGSDFQYNGIAKEGDRFTVTRDNSQQGETFTLENGSLKDSAGNFVTVSEDGTVVEGDSSSGFSIPDGTNLAYNDRQAFYACPSGSEYVLNFDNCSEGTGVALYVNRMRESSSSSAPASSASAPASSFSTPASSALSSAMSSVSLYTAVRTNTAMSTETDTITSCGPTVTDCPASHSGNSTVAPTVEPITNGAAKAGSVGIAALAAAGMMLI